MYDLTTIQLINLSAKTKSPVIATRPSVVRMASFGVRALGGYNGTIRDYLKNLERLSKE